MGTFGQQNVALSEPSIGTAIRNFLNGPIWVWKWLHFCFFLVLHCPILLPRHAFKALPRDQPVNSDSSDVVSLQYWCHMIGTNYMFYFHLHHMVNGWNQHVGLVSQCRQRHLIFKNLSTTHPCLAITAPLQDSTQSQKFDIMSAMAMCCTSSSV